MASLSAPFNVGGASASSLIKSSRTISSQLATYQDTIMKINYENSSKTDADFQVYQDYLTSRANQLNASGTVADLTKAANVQQEIVTAQKSNVSANIQRENIQIMGGNGTLTDKYNVIVSQFQRAVAIGDNALAQSLESQAYSVSQSIQYQAQESATAAATLGRANAAAQGNIVQSLGNSLKQLNNDIKNVGQVGADKIVKEWVNQNSDVLKSMGVVIPPGSQPNYFDLVKGIAGAQYNAYVLQAQIQAPYDPTGAQNTLEKAQGIQTGVTKLDTLAGGLTYQQLGQAAQNPEMFAFNSATGKFEQTQQTGYQYINGQLAPTSSGIVDKKAYDKVFYLSPTQTKEMSDLGLNFSANKNGSTGDGVQIQVTDNSPQWLKDVLGNTGTSKMFTDSAGNLVFSGSSSDGTGLGYYTLAHSGGIAGLFEHMPDGSTRLAGGNYGFDSGAAQLLVNMAQNQQQVKLAQATAQASAAKITAPTIQPLPQVNIAPPQPATQSINPAPQTKSIQAANGNPQQAAASSTKALQSSSGNIQSGGSGIKITGTTNAPIGIKL